MDYSNSNLTATPAPNKKVANAKNAYIIASDAFSISPRTKTADALSVARELLIRAWSDYKKK